MEDKIKKYGTILLLIVALAGVQHFFNKTTTVEKELVEMTSQRDYFQESTRNRTKIIEKRTEHFEQQVQKHNEYIENVSKTIASLKTENRKLTESTKRRWFKLIKPDGTIVEKEYTESHKEEVESIVTSVKAEFTRKVSAIETKWLKLHKFRVSELKQEHEKNTLVLHDSYKEQLRQERSKTTVSYGSRKYIVRAGYTSRLDYYAGFGYTLLGPLFIDSGLDFTPASLESGRIGLGIQF